MELPSIGPKRRELAQIRNRFIGFIFQSCQLLPSLTALENVMVPAEIRGEIMHAAAQRIFYNGLGWAAACSTILSNFPAENSSGSPSRALS